MCTGIDLLSESLGETRVMLLTCEWNVCKDHSISNQCVVRVREGDDGGGKDARRCHRRRQHCRPLYNITIIDIKREKVKTYLHVKEF